MNETCDTLRVSTIGVLGFVSQMTSLDLIFKVVIGLMTIIYLGTRLIDWFERRGNNNNKTKGEL